MAQQRNEAEEAHKGPTFYFLTLETHEKARHFRDEAFRTRVERSWKDITRPYERISGEEYAVNDSALHALVVMQGPETAALEELEAAVAALRAETRKAWKKKAPLWAERHKLRKIAGEEELRSIRDFIVQKMLGGKELSEWDRDAFDEEAD